MDGGVGVKFVEVSHAHGQVGVGKQLDSFGFGGLRQQGRYVGFECALLQQLGKLICTLAAFSHDDSAGVQVVVKCFAFTQELGRKNEVLGAVALSG